MTVANNLSRDQYSATSGQTVFPYTFEIFNKDDVVVVQNTTTLSEGTNYTVSGVGNNNGGNITFTSGATAGDTITIYRDMAYERTTDYQTSGDFLAAEVNADFDKLWLAVQQNEEADTRAIRKPINDLTSINMELPSATNRANRYLGFGPYGEVVTVADTGLAGEIADVKAYGADSTGTNDSTAAFQAAIDSGLSTIYIPTGTYRIDGTLTITRDLRIYGEGASSIIDTSHATDTTARLFDIYGVGPTLLQSVSGGLLSESISYTFASAPDLIPGDVIAVTDNDNYSYSVARYYYKKGEFLTVREVDGNQAWFTTGFYDDYSASGDVNIYKMNMISISMENFKLRGAVDSCHARAIYGKFLKDSTFRNLIIENAGSYEGLSLTSSYGCNIEGVDSAIYEFGNPPSFGISAINAYPIALFNCQAISVAHCKGVSRWHGFGTGGGVTIPAVVGREIHVANSVWHSGDGIPACDFHGNVEHSSMIGNKFIGGGATLGARRNVFIGNTHKDIRKYQTPLVAEENTYCFYSTETIGYDFIISNNTSTMRGSYLTSSFGRFLHMFSTQPETAATPPFLADAGSGTLLISGNNMLIETDTPPNNDYIIEIRNVFADDGAVDDVNIMITNNTFRTTRTTASLVNSIHVDGRGRGNTGSFKSTVIKDNLLDKVFVDLTHSGDVTVSNNVIKGAYRGVDVDNCQSAYINGNTITDTLAIGISLVDAYGTTVTACDNVLNNCNTTTVATADFQIYPDDLGVENTKITGNMINSNDNANYLAYYGKCKNLVDYGNIYNGSGAISKVLYYDQATGLAKDYELGSQTTNQIWHYGTTQTDFAKITFGSVYSASTLVRLHIAANAAGYSGVLEFALEGTSSSVSRVNTSYTSTNDPISGGRVIVNIATNVVTLSLDEALATDGLHVKAEIVKCGRENALNALKVEWLT